MAGTLTPIYCSEEYLPVQEIFTRYHDPPKELFGGRTTEVEGLRPSGHLQENIGQFVVTQQLYNHPMITISA